VGKVATKSNALALLLVVPLLWGATFPLIRQVVGHSDPAAFVLWRFLVAGLILLPSAIRSWHQRCLSLRDFSYGLILGLVNGIAFVLQAKALQTVGAARIAFLTGINVVMVPLLLPLFKLGYPKKIELVASVIGLVGIYSLNNASLVNFALGDIFAVISALFIALGIIFTEKASAKPCNLGLLTFYQIIFTTLIPLVSVSSTNLSFPLTSTYWLSIAYCAVFATVIPFYLQLKYQSQVGASKSALIFSLEAVAAAVFAWAIGEPITQSVICGGLIIVFSTFISDVYSLIRSKAAA
jgi:drug/metabolite transporter (DMT)-like permease